MDKPLISVIVPVYNILEYLPRCVQSLRSQTYPNLEILLVDDGSTDGTGALCDELAREDGRIRVFHKQNGGSSSARNLGIEMAAGELLGFVDSDDYVEPDMYELLQQAMEKYQDVCGEQAKVVQVGRDEIDEQGNRLPDICVPPENNTCYDDKTFLRELLLHKGDCSFCTKLLRREVLAEKRFPVGVLNEDFYLMLQILPEMGTLVSLPQQAYHVFYRIGSNSRKAEKEDFSRVFIDIVDNADMAMELVRSRYPELEPVALRFGVFQRLDYLLHIPISQMRQDNEQYRAIVHWMRKNWLRSMGNPILTGKNKVYHTLFAIAPGMVRKAHARLRHA